MCFRDTCTCILILATMDGLLVGLHLRQRRHVSIHAEHSISGYQLLRTVFGVHQLLLQIYHIKHVLLVVIMGKLFVKNQTTSYKEHLFIISMIKCFIYIIVMDIHVHIRGKYMY